MATTLVWILKHFFFTIKQPNDKIRIHHIAAVPRPCLPNVRPGRLSEDRLDHIAIKKLLYQFSRNSIVPITKKSVTEELPPKSLKFSHAETVGDR